MKRILIIIFDLLIILGSIFLSYKVLGERNMIEDYEKNIQAFYIIAPAIGILYLILMYSFGLYNYNRCKLGDTIYTVFLTSVSLMMGIMSVCFFVRGGALAFPRSVIFLSAFLYCFFLAIWRVMVWKWYKRSHGIKSAIIIGPDRDNIASVLNLKYKDMYHIQYVCDEHETQLDEWIRKSEVIFITSGVSSKRRGDILLAGVENQSEIYFVPEYRDISIMSASMQKTNDIPTFCVNRMELSIEERVVKRMEDLILAAIGLILALPIGLIIALLIKLDGGPVFYFQERLTQNGKRFKVMKFRTMVPDAEKISGPVLSGENDPRITYLGRFIRATRIDEIPQIINILKGEMSIVGPRPERHFFTEQFEKQISHYRQRLKVKAGLTGLAQVEGKYNTSVEDKLRYDLLYISKYSLFQDFLIILKTIKILFVKESTEGVASPKSAFDLESQNSQQHKSLTSVCKTIPGKFFYLKRKFKPFVKSQFCYWFKPLLPKKYPYQIYATMGRYGLHAIPYEFRLNYKNYVVEGNWDEENQLPYVIHEGKRLYFPKDYSLGKAKECYLDLLIEQDINSPHRYVKNYEELTDKTLLDIGSAEGIFTLSTIELVKHAFLFESEEKWIKPLSLTFKPWINKVTITQKYVNEFSDEDNVSIDDFLKGKNIDNLFIKMDIEGFEKAAVKGAKKTFCQTKKVSGSICTYHKENDLNELNQIMKEYGLVSMPGDGYMFFGDQLRKPILRVLKPSDLH